MALIVTPPWNEPMHVEAIAPKVFAILLGPVNVFLLESEAGLVLIDTGVPGSAGQILNAVASLGQQPADVGHILVTHWHPDHMGSLAALKRATGAVAYAHPIDAPIIRTGGDFDPNEGVPRPFYPAPGMEARFRETFTGPALGIEGADIEHEIVSGDQLPFLPDLQVIFAPGHSHGQVVFLWPLDGGVLFAADTCANTQSLSWSLGYEDLEEGQRTLKNLGLFDFQKAVFGHGRTLLKEAGTIWRKQWGDLPV